MTRSLIAFMTVFSSLLFAARSDTVATDPSTTFKPTLRTAALEAQTMLLFASAFDAVIDVDLVDTHDWILSRFGLRLLYGTAEKGLLRNSSEGYVTNHLGNLVAAMVRGSARRSASKLDVCLGYGYARNLEADPRSGTAVLYNVEARMFIVPPCGSFFFRAMGRCYPPSPPAVLFGISIGYHD